MINRIAAPSPDRELTIRRLALDHATKRAVEGEEIGATLERAERLYRYFAGPQGDCIGADQALRLEALNLAYAYDDASPEQVLERAGRYHAFMKG